MVAQAIAVRFQLGDIEIEAYQLAEEKTKRLLFTHRQIGEVVGKSKGSAQKFCKSHEQELPPTVSAIVPDKPRPVALSSWEAALAYWQHQAQSGNAIASALVTAAEATPISELNIEVASVQEESNPPYPKDIEAAIATLPAGNELPNSHELQLLDESLSLIAKWLEEAGLDQKAIASWKLNILASKFPTLAEAATEAQKLIATNDASSSSGMIASQVAEKVSSKLKRKITAAQVNSALHELGIQEWAKPGSRERKLTDKGKEYGRAMLATSKTNAWSGAQLRWFDNVVPLLCQYFQAEQVTGSKEGRESGVGSRESGKSSAPNLGLKR
ncbi:MAG: hypothetical protein WA919_24315 [Coleofasciculaceae cyanobacterium]